MAQTFQLAEAERLIDDLVEALREIDRSLSTGGKGDHHARLVARAAIKAAKGD